MAKRTFFDCYRSLCQMHNERKTDIINISITSYYYRLPFFNEEMWMVPLRGKQIG